MPAREGAANSSPRDASSRVRTRTAGRVRVWSEASVTLCVTENPNQYVKFSLGAETFCRDTNTDRKAAEKELYDWCEQSVGQRVDELSRLIRAANS